MPTIRPRHMITETDEVAAAIDAAARVWPDDRDDRAALLRRLIARGADVVTEADERRRAERRAAIRAVSGSFQGIWKPGDVEAMRREWPE